MPLQVNAGSLQTLMVPYAPNAHHQIEAALLLVITPLHGVVAAYRRCVVHILHQGMAETKLERATTYDYFSAIDIMTASRRAAAGEAIATAEQVR